MRTANGLVETTTAITFKHRDWCVIPDAIQPNWFKLKETKTGKVLAHFMLYQSGDSGLLNRIACAPELEDIAEMYHATTIGEQAKKPVETSAAFKGRQWRVIPNGSRPGWFTLQETKTAKVLGTFTLPEGGDSAPLHLIACVPELERTAKTFRNAMTGHRYEKSMVFSAVTEVLQRLHRPTEALQCF